MPNPNKPIDKPDRLPDVELEPPADLRKEWQNEDIETEGRKPNLEEDEEDTIDL
jgi:hypothetical protein